MPAKDLTQLPLPAGCRLTPLRRVGARHRHAVWLCRCACGREVEALSHHVLSGAKRSCGCLVADANGRPELAGRNAAIRAARKQGRSYAGIGAEFGLTHEYVRRVCLGEGA